MKSYSMKDNWQLSKYLIEYIKMKKPQFAVMITGKWGCGKTYYINHQIEEWKKYKNKTDKDSIELKPIYISVNGLHSISDVARKIRTALYPILYSKGVAVAKKVALTGLQILAKTKVDFDKDGSGEELDGFLDAEGIIEIFKNDSDSIKGDRILIFDDLERCKVPLDELFGFINGIVEHSDSKVILVCEEDKLKKSADKDELKVSYKDFKEKLVGQTFSLAVDYAGMAESFINASKDKILIENKNLIVELFVASRCENLRLIKHCLIDIKRLFEQISRDVEENPNYQVFVSNVIAYLVITSLEERYGNLDIEKFQSFDFSEEGKRANNQLESKYLSILQRFQMYSSVYTIPISQLLGFIRTGYLESPEYLLSCCRLLQSRNIADWEKLWHCKGLTNDDFLKILKKEKERFFKKELEYAFEVAHLSGILLSLEKRGLVKLSRSFVVSTAKKNIECIYKTYPDDWSRVMLNGQGYEFKESGSAEMKAILSYAAMLFQKRVNKLEKEYVMKVWNSLGPDTTRDSLNAQFDQPTPTKRCHYSDESIFTQVSPRVMANKIVALPNAAKEEFASFLIERYYLPEMGVIGTIMEEKRADKDNLAKISAFLRTRSKRLKLLDKEKMLYIAKKMDQAVEKM